MSLERLLILTGDPSADMHAAHIVQAIRAKSANVDIHAVGSHCLQETGVPLISDQSKMARMGLGSIWGAWDHWQLGQKILKHCESWLPDAVLFIDYGVFHLWMAGQLKKRFKSRCPKLYYFIPPQVWASRRQRIKKIKRSMDHVFCIFPFEKALYEAHDIPVTYVGHPLISQLPSPADRSLFCEKHGLDSNKPIVGLFPGSRKMEIEHLLPPFMASTSQIKKSVPDVQFVLAKATHLKSDYFNDMLKRTQQIDTPPIHVIENENHAILSICDALIVASGTVTLEAALYGTPLILLYKGHPIAYQLAMRILDLPYVGLPNILHSIPDINHPKTNLLPPIVPELLQHNATAENITQHIVPLLDPKNPQRQAIQAVFKTIRDNLTASTTEQQGSAAKIADTLLST